jgi:hypothetical protein
MHWGILGTCTVMESLRSTFDHAMGYSWDLILSWKAWAPLLIMHGGILGTWYCRGKLEVHFSSCIGVFLGLALSWKTWALLLEHAFGYSWDFESVTSNRERVAIGFAFTPDFEKIVILSADPRWA